MSGLLDAIVFWHWLILGVVLMTAETMLPGSFLLWCGFGAITTGVMVWLIPTLSWHVQIIFFALVSMTVIILWRRYRAANPEVTSHPSLNQRGLNYIGRRFTLSDPIIDGVGRMNVDDSTWRIEGDDLPVNTAVVVVSVDGTVLRVKRAE